MKNKRYFPLYVDLSDKNIVVVGGEPLQNKRKHYYYLPGILQ